MCRCFLCMWCLVPPTAVDIPLWLHSVSLLAPKPGQPGAHMLWKTLPCPCFVRLTFNSRSDNTRPPLTETVPTTRPCLCNLDSKGVWNSHTFQHPCWPLLFSTTKRSHPPHTNSCPIGTTGHWLSMALHDHNHRVCAQPKYCATITKRRPPPLDCTTKAHVQTQIPACFSRGNTLRHDDTSSTTVRQNCFLRSTSQRPSPVVRSKQARHI